MNLLISVTAIIVGAFAITSAIRVPTAWPTVTPSPTSPALEADRRRYEFRPQTRLGSEIPGHYHHHHRPAPYGGNTINSAKRHNTRHQNLKTGEVHNGNAEKIKAVAKQPVFTATANDWIPIVYPKPHHSAYYAHTSPQTVNNKNHNNYGGPKPGQYGGGYSNDHNAQAPYNVQHKNYRDDKTHEPQANDDDERGDDEARNEENQEEDEDEESGSDEEEENTESSHEKPKDIPTRPIYPGPGKWAQRGVKHQPHISPHRFGQQTAQQHETDDEAEPEGYEVFLKNRHIFDKHQDRFRQNLDLFPQKYYSHSYGKSQEQPENYNKPNENHQTSDYSGKQHDSYSKPTDEHEEHGEDDDEEHEFTPTRLYSQVRRSETEEHLPRLPEDERLKEVVKDSKIQTVYTEEGYEDIAYDHAGHEKNAAEEEGFNEFDKEIEKERERQKELDEEDADSSNHGDSDAAGSQYETADKNSNLAKDKNHNIHLAKNNLIKTKETKTTAVKKANDGNKELEISSEIKYVVTPDNATEAHKFVKIFPKTTKIITNVTNHGHMSGQKLAINATSTDNDIKKVPNMIDQEPIEQKQGNRTYKDNGAIDKVTSSDKKILTTPAYQFPSFFPKDNSVNKTVVNVTAPVDNSLAQITKSFEQVKRLKRFAIDYPKIEIDTKFIDQIKHPHLPPPTTEDPRKHKYPYYNDPRINPDSPLRYSEDMSNIPPKQDEEMAFYKQADRVECPEVETDIDPIPERVKTADSRAEDMEQTTDVQDLVKSPRLGGLGDKIDCFKRKYFGEEPLDSPFFDEQTIGPVVPLFATTKSLTKPEESNLIEDLPKLVHKQANLQKSASVISDGKKQQIKANYKSLSIPTKHQSNLVQSHSIKAVSKVKTATKTNQVGDQDQNKALHNKKILKGVTHQVNQSALVESTTSKFDIEGRVTEVTTNKPNPDGELAHVQEITDDSANKSEIATVLIITTPKYTIDLQPKHIYDQIELLQHLPSNQKLEINQNAARVQEVKNSVETQTDASIAELSQQTPEEEQPHPSNTTEQEHTRQSKKIDEQESMPESQALILHKRRRRIRPRPMFHIFDINKFLPTHPKFYLDLVTSTTAAPPSKRMLSEVQYKNEIKPSEQLNVLSDVINNIKNSSRDNQQLGSVHATDRVPFNLNQHQNLQYTTTMRPVIATLPRNTKKHATHRTNHLYEDLVNQDNVQYDNIELLKVNAQMPTTTILGTSTITTTNKRNPYLDSLPDDSSIEEATTPSTIVLGLMPPLPIRYKTIYSPIVRPSMPLITVNTFYVQGMKPPTVQQKAHSYSEFKLPSKVKIKYNLRRSKRSPSRSSYSQVVRNRNKPIDVEDDGEAIDINKDDDDYVPHRPTNYHYDEKTGRIVYDQSKKQDPVEEEEVIEVTDPPIPKPTRKSQSATTPAAGFFERFVDTNEGPSYVEFVKKLKTDAKYVPVPDPTTTEKGTVVATTSATTTAQPIPTKAPEFLSILSKVKTNPNYKPLEDKKKTTTTTEASVPEVEANAESRIESVQNAPSLPSAGPIIGQGFQIFDISEYLPKIRNYMPKTTIDYAKYKTIERPNLRHNLSSRYNSEDESLEEVKTVRVPILLEKAEDKPEKFEINPVMSESRYEEGPVSSEEITTTTTTNSPSITRTKSRFRGRPTRRPAVLSTTTTTQSSAIEDSSTTQDKPKRVFPRRRPVRIQAGKAITTSTTTTESLNPEASESEDTTKILRRRHQDDGLQSSNEATLLQTTTTPSTIIPDADKDRLRKEAVKRRVRLIVHPAKNNSNKASEIEKKVEPKQSADDRVEVFKKYDPTKKHGGNYRREEEVMMNENTDDKNNEKDNADNSNSDSSNVDEEKGGDDSNKEGSSKKKVHVPQTQIFNVDPLNVNELIEPNITQVEDVINEDKDDKDEEDEATYDESEADPSDLDDKKALGSANKPTFIKDPSKRLYFYAPI